MVLLPWLIFTLVVGACVGSFLNVVIYRLPEGRSIVTPPSSCPKCGNRLAWYDNVPVLGWLWLRGKCRSCQQPISIQYPIVEAITALLFVGLFAVYYFTDLRPEFSLPGSQFGFGVLPLLSPTGIEATWLPFVVHLVLLGSMIAATVIDARLYIIPLQIPWFATAVAVVLLPLGAVTGLIPPHAEATVPWALGGLMWLPFGALAGLLLALALLQAGVIPRSFIELESEVTDPQPSDNPEAFLAHPHPRREVFKECLFLALPVLGAVLAFVLGPPAPGLGNALPWHDPRFGGLPVLGGVLLGYFVGCALVWGTRILGTLAFGKEAMGLGDVHLMGAIGAVLGPVDAVFVFFSAPFMGLLAALISVGAAAIWKGERRIIPYGPYLCGGALLLMAFRHEFYAFFDLAWAGPYVLP